MALLTPLNVNCHASDGRKVRAVRAPAAVVSAAFNAPTLSLGFIFDLIFDFESAGFGHLFFFSAEGEVRRGGSLGPSHLTRLTFPNQILVSWWKLCSFRTYKRRARKPTRYLTFPG